MHVSVMSGRINDKIAWKQANNSSTTASGRKFLKDNTFRELPNVRGENLVSENVERIIKHNKVVRKVKTAG